MSVAGIKKQIEFYFSDSNFRRDNFLKTHADSDPEGFVPIDIILTFNKIKVMNTTVEAIANAMESSTSVILSEDKTKLRRSHPLPEADSTDVRTLYVKGYPTNDPDVTIDSISDQFSQFGKVNLIRMRKTNASTFKGSVFIEFDDEASIEKACKAAHDEESGKVILCYKETPFLCVMPFKQWHANKKAQVAMLKAKKATTKGSTAFSSSSSSNTTKESNLSKKRKQPDSGNSNSGDSGDNSSSGDSKLDEQNKEISFTPGLIIKVSSLPSDATFQAIKESFKTLGKVQYVEFNVGDPQALLRVYDNQTASKILSVVQDGFKLSLTDEKMLTAELLSGDDEIAFWKRLEEQNKNSRGRFSSSSSNRGRGKKQHGNKRFKR